MISCMVKVVVTKPMGSSCRKLIYNAAMVVEKLSLDLEIVEVENSKIDPDQPVVPPYILIGDLVLSKSTPPERLEQIIKSIVSA
ncbi:hypothetical protein [Desulfolucanica intricata]|uniref:hypothetical protein n=1 Tax=Desulfolucanica intricata TaxID=1285191 RepID=UPI00082C91A1|nr:hypothetical protein [Desulfolucanica intricata]